MQTDTVVKHDWRGELKDVGWPIKAAVGLVLLSGLFALVAHESSYVLAAPLALFGWLWDVLQTVTAKEWLLLFILWRWKNQIVSAIRPIPWEQSLTYRILDRILPKRQNVPVRASQFPAPTTQDEPPHLIVP